MQKPTDDPVAMRAVCVIMTTAFIVLFLVLPLVTVFSRALASGIAAALGSIVTDDAWSAVRLTRSGAGISVPRNMVFGICAGGAIAK